MRDSMDPPQPGKIPLSKILNAETPENNIPTSSTQRTPYSSSASVGARRYGSSTSPTASFTSPPPSLPSPTRLNSNTLPPVRTDRPSPSPLVDGNSPLSAGRDKSSSSDANDALSWPRSNSSPTSTILDGERRPRAPRPSYSEEQKFYIMYARIIRDNTWPEIEERFDKLFGTRTKGGLTSVYYRVRREWGLQEVLKSGPGSYVADCREVEQRAMNFSREFLAQIGYLPSAS